MSDVGRYDVVTETPSLDPRMTNGWNTAEYAKPIARIWAAPAVVKEGGTILLDGGASTSPAGTTITQYTWTLLQPPS